MCILYRLYYKSYSHNRTNHMYSFLFLHEYFKLFFPIAFCPPFGKVRVKNMLIYEVYCFSDVG